MTLEETRQRVVSRLGVLQGTKFTNPTAMDLRGPRQMMGRVQRQENVLHKKRILKQQKDFQLKLAKIDKYYSDLQTEEDRRLDLLADYEKIVAPDYPMPVFQPIGSVVPEPVISVPGMPLYVRKNFRIPNIVLIRWVCQTSLVPKNCYQGVSVRRSTLYINYITNFHYCFFTRLV